MTWNGKEYEDGMEGFVRYAEELRRQLDFSRITDSEAEAMKR